MYCPQIPPGTIPPERKTVKTRKQGAGLLQWLGPAGIPYRNHPPRGIVRSSRNDSAVFVVSGWRFRVRTDAAGVIRELSEFLSAVGQKPKADVTFTAKLLHMTEERKIEGWAWEKERICPEVLDTAR